MVELSEDGAGRGITVVVMMMEEVVLVGVTQGDSGDDINHKVAVGTSECFGVHKCGV